MSTLHIRFAPAGFGAWQHCRALEVLLARGTKSALGDWRAAAFRAIAAVPGDLPSIGPTLLAAAAARPDGAWACVATPVHWRAGMSSVRMSADGLVKLEAGEAEHLAAAFNRTFTHADVRLSVGPAAALLCVFDRLLEVSTCDPERSIGQDLFDYLPGGADAGRVRRLMSEIELWLFDHPLNRAREAHGHAPITGLWLWGGGPVTADVPSVRGFTAGRDVFFAAFGDAPAFPQRPMNAACEPGVMVCEAYPGTPPWPELEERWFSPAAAALRSGRLARLDISRAAVCFSMRAGRDLQFWRKRKPWWEHFDLDPAASVDP